MPASGVAALSLAASRYWVCTHQHPRPFGLFVLMEYFPQGDKGVAVVEEDRFEKLSCLDTGKTLMGNNLNDVGRMFNFYSPPVLIAGDICDSHS
jgi:hypothetical protein